MLLRCGRRRSFGGSGGTWSGSVAWAVSLAMRGIPGRTRGRRGVTDNGLYKFRYQAIRRLSLSVCTVAGEAHACPWPGRWLRFRDARGPESDF